MRESSDERRLPVRQTTDGPETAERHRSSEKNPEETAAPVSTSATTDLFELETAIRRRAYERYLSRGDGPGSEVEDWCAAERDVYEAQWPTDASTAHGRAGEQGHAPSERSEGEPRAARRRRSTGRRAASAGTESNGRRPAPSVGPSTT